MVPALLRSREAGLTRTGCKIRQNLPKKQEAELRRAFSPNEAAMLAVKGWAGMECSELKKLGVLDEAYYPIRSCFVASPGHVFIEADYCQAELNVLAYISKDPSMMAVMNDPTRDLHSEMAVKGYHLSCIPAEVKKLWPHYRVLAKASNFGIAYGRGANALVRAAQAEGVETDKASAQRLIDTFFNEFPQTKVFFEECHEAVIDPGYVENAFGRRRYFLPTDDERIRAKQEREAGNMPIQGTVGDALSIALYNLYRLRNAYDMKFRLVLTIHDAVILEVPVAEVEEVKSIILPACMSAGARIPTIGLTLGIDIEVMRRWGEHISEEQALEEASKEAT